MNSTYDRNNFIPWRLTEAREILGMTKNELADQLGITRGAVAQFESGRTKPSAETFGRMTFLLRQDSRFFLHSPARDYVSTEISYRKLVSKAARNERIAKIKTFHVNDVMEYAFTCIQEEKPNIEEGLFENNPESLDVYDIEAKAMQLRESWGVGDLPIRNLTVLLENHGIICIDEELPKEISAFSYWVDFSHNGLQHPVIIQNQSLTYFRQRFTLAHELGHIVLHRYVDNDEMELNHKLYEEQAFRFASAFLMPAQRFSDSLYVLTLKAMPEQKRRWGVSIASIVKRLNDLELIDDEHYKYLQIEISRKGWKKREPLDRETPREAPCYMNRAFDFIVANKLGTAFECSSYTGLRMDELARISSNQMFSFVDGNLFQPSFFSF